MQTQIIATQNRNATITVGKNDTLKIAVDSKMAAKPVTTTARIKALVDDRKAWEHCAYVKSNEQLYAVLGDCYALYFDLRGADKETKAARAELDELCKQKGYRFNEGTHVLTKLVKYVFDGIDRRRVSAYSLVLREALAQETKVGGISAFINNNGGVEEIRRSKSKTAKTPAQKAELGKQAVANNKLAVINDAALTMLVQHAEISAGDDLVAILTQQSDGTFVVRHLVFNKSVLNAARACAYSSTKAVVLNDKAANDDKLMEDLMLEAANA